MSVRTLPIVTATRSLALFLGLAVLSGCSSGGATSSQNGLVGVGQAAIRQILSGGQSRFSNVTASDAELRGFANPLIVVTGLKTGSNAVFGVVSNRDGTAIWESANERTFTLRDGLLVASRGFGADLMSADEPDVRRGLGEITRDHYYLGGNELIQRDRFFCTLQSLGNQRVIVTGVTSTARLVTEECQGEDTRFENRYWIEPGGLIRKSVQWLGPDNGSFQIEVVPQGRSTATAAMAGITISE